MGDVTHIVFLKKEICINVFLLRLILWRLFSKKKVYAHISCFRRWHSFNTVDQLAPPPLVLFGLRLPPVHIQGLAMLVSPSVTHVSTISLHPLHLRVFYSAVCDWANIWTILIKLFLSKTVDELQDFFFFACSLTQNTIHWADEWMLFILTNHEFDYCIKNTVLCR